MRRWSLPIPLSSVRIKTIKHVSRLQHIPVSNNSHDQLAVFGVEHAREGFFKDCHSVGYFGQFHVQKVSQIEKILLT